MAASCWRPPATGPPTGARWAPLRWAMHSMARPSGCGSWCPTRAIAPTTCCRREPREPTGRTGSCCRARWPRLADLLFLHQAQVAAHVQAQVPGKEAGDALDVKGAVGEVGAGVGRALDDPDLARSPVRVVKAAAVNHRGHLVRPAVDEEERTRLQRTEHRLRAALRQQA